LSKYSFIKIFKVNGNFLLPCLGNSLATFYCTSRSLALNGSVSEIMNTVQTFSAVGIEGKEGDETLTSEPLSISGLDLDFNGKCTCKNNHGKEESNECR
jgi:hypothetical protein